MTLHLPADLQRFVQDQVRSGRFTSEEDAVAAGLRLLRQRQEAENAHTLESIGQGIEEMKAGKGRPAEEVFADIRREFNLPPDA